VTSDRRTGTSDSAKLAAFMLLFFVGWTVRATFLLAAEKNMQPPIAREVYGHALRALVWVVPVLVYLRRVDHAPVLAFLKLDRLPRGHNLRIALLWIAGFLAAEIALDVATGRRHGVGRWPEGWAHALLGLPWAPVMEEILFRGFFFSKLRERVSFLRANLVTSALFVAIHWPGWLTLNGWHPGFLFVTSGSIFLLALVLAYLVERTRSLYPSIALHILNNLVSLTA
jgi:membrane protease YdiL (CAAX protease family)